MVMIVCPNCGQEVEDGNFCSVCAWKLKDVCDCWVKKQPHDCGREFCPGLGLLVEDFKVILGS